MPNYEDSRWHLNRAASERNQAYIERARRREAFDKWINALINDQPEARAFERREGIASQDLSEFWEGLAEGNQRQAVDYLRGPRGNSQGLMDILGLLGGMSGK